MDVDLQTNIDISYTDSWQCIWCTYTRLVLIRPRSESRWVICTQAVYMSPFTISRICITTL